MKLIRGNTNLRNGLSERGINMIDYIIGGLVILAVVLSIMKIRKDRKSGSCCGGCSGCSSEGSCNAYQEFEAEAKEKLRDKR